MESWHHLQNDRWITEVVFPGLRGGFFVEAGACGGKHQSATYVLETELGWDGICVEPGDYYYGLLVRTRQCRTDNRCLWSRTGDRVPFSSFPTDPALSRVSATIEEPIPSLQSGQAVTAERQTVHAARPACRALGALDHSLRVPRHRGG